MSRVAIPAVVVMVAVVSLLATAQWNASSAPDQVITLTERELALPFRPVSTDDDPGLQLQFRYHGRFDPLDARNWISDARLREIGFALHIPTGSPQAVYTYDQVPARVGWVVFEYDGAAWREIERRRQLRADDRHAPDVPSRLVPVDAGADYERLRVRYASGYLIVRAVFGLSYVASANGGPLLHGRLQQIVPRELAVPHEYRSMLMPFGESPHGPSEPRYEVDVAVGRLGLPYITAVRFARGGGN